MAQRDLPSTFITEARGFGALGSVLSLQLFLCTYITWYSRVVGRSYEAIAVIKIKYPMHFLVGKSNRTLHHLQMCVVPDVTKRVTGQARRPQIGMISRARG